MRDQRHGHARPDKIVDHLTPAQCRQTIEELIRVEAACEPFSALESRDRIWALNALGWSGRASVVVNDLLEFEKSGLAGTLFPNGYEQPFLMESARLRLLCARLALRAYAAERGGLPEKWDDLVTAGLPELGIDPFDPAGGQLRFRRTDGGYLLYSLGQNRVDDGGAPPQKYSDPTLASYPDLATGDLILDAEAW